jgi:hypothetical protein
MSVVAAATPAYTHPSTKETRMNTLSRLLLLVIYGLAAASLMTTLPLSPGMVQAVQIGAAVLLGVHALELGLAWRHVRLYSGPLAVSMLLTLLFGLLHWKPLANAAQRRSKR